jgi:hypothetical protein
LNATTVQIIAAVIFTIAVLHTFAAKFFERLAHRYPSHSGAFHLLGEVEAVFGFWAMVLMIFMAFSVGIGGAVEYLEGRNYTEPLFVFVIMVIAASKPILRLALASVEATARMMPMHRSVSIYFLSLSLLPLLGSFITEPAAMTLAALMLRARYYNAGISNRLMYATIGVLFVNVSIGGTLTPYAAPPVLMVAAQWGWDLPFMVMNFGWRSAIAVIINAAIVTMLFRAELARIPVIDKKDDADRIPAAMTILHVLFLAGVVVAAHHPVVFMGLFLFFLGIASAYERYQERLILREGLMVAFFLAGLVVLGGQQQWWLQPALQAMSPTAVYYGATALTAITDNAALTYLGSLVEGLSDEFKISLVAGAVTGGGLTVIANAPNPAGYSILRSSFSNQEISAGGLFVAAFPPTLVAIIMFRAF